MHKTSPTSTTTQPTVTSTTNHSTMKNAEEGAYDGYHEQDFLNDIPEELNESYDKCDEAYFGYIKARRRMKDLVTARGLHPIMAAILQ